MNIGTLQLTTINNAKPLTVSTQTPNNSKFGEIFSQLTNKDEALPININITEDLSLDQLGDLLESSTLEEVLGLLGISNEVENDAETSEELLNLEDLLKVLQIDDANFIQQFQELIEEDYVDLNDIADLINLVNNQPQELLSKHFIKGLNGEHHVSPQTVQQQVIVLKVVEMISSNTNQFIEQQNQLVDLKELLQGISNELKMKNNQTSNKTETNLFFTRVVNFKLQSEQSNEVLSGQHQELLANNSIPTTAMSKSVTITLPVEKSAQSEEFIKEFQSLLNRTQFSNTQGTMKLLVKLYPENLGSIRIEIFQKDGVLSARLLASTSQAKELLDSQVHQLKTAFAQQNIQMDRIDIAQSLQETDRNLRDQSLFGNMFKQQQSDQNDDEQEENKQDDAKSFEDYLLNEEV